MNLQDFFEQHKKVAIAFSGGVDSSYLLYSAKQYTQELKAYYIKTSFQPQFEYDDAVRLAQELNVSLTVIDYDILNNKKIIKNPADRCYHCKKELFSVILKRAAEDGYEVLLDGTNASDRIEDRPGIKALEELKVMSPLKECGLTKKEIRKLSKEAGLFTWDKPAYACLATRLPGGSLITNERLVVTERAEYFIKSLGFKDFRVRMLEDSGFGQTSDYRSFSAKLEISTEDLPLLTKKRKLILQELKKYYNHVTLDLEMRDE